MKIDMFYRKLKRLLEDNNWEIVLLEEKSDYILLYIEPPNSFAKGQVVMIGEDKTKERRKEKTNVS